QLWEGERRFGVVVRLQESQRRDVDSIKTLLIDTPSGSYVPLEQVASVSLHNGSMNISRESGMRVACIGVFIRGRDMGSIVNEMQNLVRSRVKLPAGYFLAWGGEFENQQRAMARLAVIVPVSLLLIFMLLFNAFNSIRSALLILLNVPLALIGGIVALYLTG